MPWDASGAHKHKHGMSDKQASKWAKIANAVLKACQSEGGKDCEGRAVRVANSRVGMGGAKKSS